VISFCNENVAILWKIFEKRISCLKFPVFGGDHQNSKKLKAKIVKMR
jgi:hypothetical protein